MSVPRVDGTRASAAASKPGSPPPPGNAVVIGGSMGALLAARVLADRFARVTVIDRDQLPVHPDHRQGVPQSHHPHALLLRGQQILSRPFPGILDDLHAGGAASGLRPPVFVTAAGKLPSPPALRTPPPAGAESGVYASRILLDWHVRHRLGERPGIHVLGDTEGTGLVAIDGNTRVAGVRLRRRPAVGGPGAEYGLGADLIVDASGRNSTAPAWLLALGYPSLLEEIVHSGIGYASRLYRKPLAWSDEWDGLLVNDRRPSNPRAGLILPIENGRAHVSLGGFAGHHPPTDEDGFLAWARSLPDPSLYEAIRVAEPVSPIRGYRTPQNRLRRFDRLRHWPEGFVVIGDAVCAFNPIYGQGMTVAAIGAELLGQALAQQRDSPRPDFARSFQRDLGKAVAHPWLIASGEDRRWGVAVTGARPTPGSGLVRRNSDRVLRRARKDPAVSGAYLNVISMVESPRSLFAPRVLLPVLADAAAALIGANAQPPEEFALSPAAISGLRALPAMPGAFVDARAESGFGEESGAARCEETRETGPPRPSASQTRVPQTTPGRAQAAAEMQSPVYTG